MRGTNQKPASFVDETNRNVLMGILVIATLLLTLYAMQWSIFAALGCLLSPFACFLEPHVGAMGASYLFLGLVPAIAIRHFLRPYPRWWPAFARFSAVITASLSPVIFYASLCRVYHYAGILLGHTPRLWAESSNYLRIPKSDSVYYGLMNNVDHTMAYAGVGSYVTFALLLHLVRSKLPGIRGVILVLCLHVGLWSLVSLSHPFAWWMDL